MPGAFVTNITASPMRLTTFAPAAAITSPVVASNRVEHRPRARDGSSSCDSPCSRRGRRSPTASCDDVRASTSARRRRCSAGRSPASWWRCNVSITSAIAREQLRRRRRGSVRATSTNCCSRERAAPRRSSAAARSRLRRSAPIASPIVRTSCSIVLVGRRTRVSCANELEQRDVGSAEAALERPRVGEARRPARPRSANVDVDPGALPRPPRASSRSPSGRRAAERGEAQQPALLVGLHELGDRRADLVGEVVEQREPLGRVGRVRVVAARPRRGRRARRTSSSLTRTARASSIVVPADAARIPSASSGAGGSASSVSPAASLDDHAGSSAGARSSTPAGASHSSAGPRAVPAHRERQRPARAAAASCTASDWPSHSGGKPGSSSTRRRSRREHLRAARAGTGRRASRVERAHVAHVATARAAGPARRARQPRRAHTARRFVVEAPVFERGDHVAVATAREQQVGARRVDRRAARRPAARPAARARAGASQPRSTASGIGEQRATSTRRRRAERDAQHRAVRHREQQRDLDRRVARSTASGATPHRPHRLATSDPAAHAPRRARQRQHRRAVDATHAPSSRDRARASTRTTSAIVHGAGDAFSTSTTIAPVRTASRRTRAARRRRPAPARPSRRRRGAGPPGRVDASSAGTCQPSSAPTHQSSVERRRRTARRAVARSSTVAHCAASPSAPTSTLRASHVTACRGARASPCAA